MPVCFALRMGALSLDNLSRPQEPITCMTHSDFSIDDWVDMFDLYVFSSHTVQDEDALHRPSLTRDLIEVIDEQQ